MNRSSHTSMLQAHANAPHYHEQQQQQQQQQHHQQQQQQPRYFLDQASPPMSSSSYHRASMSSQQGGYSNINDLGGGGSNNNGQYRTSQQYPNMRPSQSHPQQQQQPQQPYHQQHQQQGYAQSSYHPSHVPNHHHHSSSPNQEQDYYQSSPAVQTADPTFTQRPHSRSFSGATHPHPYSQYATPNSSHYQQQQQQQRLHHSVSAGHLPIAGHRSAPISFGPVPTSAPPAKPNNMSGTGVAPKKKDPYATAWRTYSKIAEELNLLNPDGTLYPISKEAILKYLHHQSKRIKSSNLHWYVNGLKKHQEGLGFAWDDVRYDEQVVALLKELTLHPVTIDNGGGSNNIYPPARQAASVSMPIDTSKIANLSISGNSHSQHYSQQQHHQHQQQHNQPCLPSSSSAFPVGSKRHPAQNQYEESPSNQSHMRSQHHMYSDRAQPPPGTSHSSSRSASFHSAPIPLPSHHAYDERMAQDQVRYKNNSHNMGEVSPRVSNSATSSPMSSSEIQTGLHHHQQSPSSMSNSSHVKRKRHELAPAARLVSPTSMEGDELDENDSVARGAEDMEGQSIEDMDEDHRERLALKRHASTGTLQSQNRHSTMSGMSSDHHLYHRQGDLGGGRDYPVTTPSPGPRENESGGHFRWGSSESAPQSRLSPGSVTASSIGSTSPGSRANNGSSKDYRSRRPNGVVSSPISSVASSSGVLSGTASTSATMVASGMPSSTASVAATTSSSTPYNKTTVHFSEVVEYAQQLQIKYGGRCPDHRWGCVELTEDYHLELSIKMYMDWAGLVASGRLTMDELPDLPEFRRPSGGGSLDTSISSSPTPGPSAVVPGTVRGMTSTPISTTFRSSPAPKSEDQSPTTSSLASGQFTFSHSGNHQRPRSPSSPIFGARSGSGQTPREGFISDSLMSRIGSPPPHMIPSPPSATMKQLSGSPSSVSARARARKMASSPSLGQHSSFQRFGLSSPPVPPVPTIPSSIVAQAQAGRISLKKTSQGELDGRGSLRPEEMELSADEDVVLRQSGSRAVLQRRLGGGSGRQGREHEHKRDLVNEDMDMDEAQMMDDVETHRSSAQFKREQQYRRESYERRPEPVPASAPAPAPAPRERAQEVKANPDMDSDVDDDEERGSDPYLKPAEVRKSNSGGNGALSTKRHQHRERQDEGVYNDYEHSSRYHRSQQGQSLQQQREPWGNPYPNDRDLDRDRDRDFDRVEEVRMGIKSMSSSSDSPSMHKKSTSANGPSKVNEDPTNILNQPSATEQEEYRRQQHGYEQKRKVEGDNDTSMMET